MTASHHHLLVAASHRRLLLAASHRNRVLAASRHKQPPPCAAGLHLARSPPSCCHRLGSSGSDTNCWRCISQRLFFFNSNSLKSHLCLTHSQNTPKEHTHTWTKKEIQQALRRGNSPWSHERLHLWWCPHGFLSHSFDPLK
jgi:hypothetical protein